MARKPVNRTRAPLERKRPPEQQDQINSYALKVGRALVEWNGLHTWMFQLFWALVGDKGKRPRDLATSLWNLSQSDDQRRRLLLIFAENILFDRKSVLDRIRWLMRSADSVAQYRNLAAHMPVEFTGSATGDSRLTLATDGVRRAHLLSAIFTEYEEPEFWDVLHADLYVLSQYAFALAFHLTSPHIAPFHTLPYRPRLRSLAAMKRANLTMRRVTSAPKRRRRRRTSKRKS